MENNETNERASERKRGQRLNQPPSPATSHLRQNDEYK